MAEIILKPEIAAKQFASDAHREICPGFTVISCHPAILREATLMVMGLSISVKDQVVKDYEALLGGKVTTTIS